MNWVNKLSLRSPSEIEKKKSKSKSPQPEESDDRRRFLRDVEVKVMRFVDKLEQKGASKSGLNIQKEAAKFRQQLIDVCKFSPSLCIQRTFGLHGVSF